MSKEVYEGLINEFRSLVDSGMSKSLALDAVVENNSEWSQPAIRWIFKDASGWNYQQSAQHKGVKTP